MNAHSRVDVLIVEDHRLLGQLAALEFERRGIEAVVADLDQPVDPTEARLVLLDIELGECKTRSLELCERAVDAGVPVVLFTGITDEVMLGRFLEAGASGIIGKTEELGVLASQVEHALDGKPIGMRPAERDRLLHALQQRRASVAESLAPFRELSESEADVLALLVDGHAVPAIAEHRFVSVATIRSQVRSIHTKLGVHNQLGAVALANRVGWSPAATNRG